MACTIILSLLDTVKKMCFAGFFGSIPKELMAKISFQLTHISTWVFPRTDKLPYLMLPFTSVVAALWAPPVYLGKHLLLYLTFQTLLTF